MAIIGLAGARGSGRSTAASALELLGYERAGIRERLRYLININAGLSEEVMTKRSDEQFSQSVVLQPYHIDGMVRTAATWRPIAPAAASKMREAARHQQLDSARAVMDFVFELFATAVGDGFWNDVFRQHHKPEAHSNLVVEDVSSASERAFIRELDGLLIGIERPGLEADLSDCDLIVSNDTSVADLQDQLLAAVVGRLRGTPMALAGGSADSAQEAKAAALEAELAKVQAKAAKDLAAQKKRLDALQAELQQAIGERDDRIAELMASQAAAASREAKSQRTKAAAPSQLAPAGEGGSQSAQSDSATAVLVARLALAMGYHAGLGKDASGQSLVCVDLPAGQVCWPVGPGLDAALPRYDKGIEASSEADRTLRLLEPGIPAALSTDRALAREGSTLASLSWFLQDLILLAEGCKVHRAYRAKRAPTGNCPTCWAMWEGSERLGQLSTNYLVGMDGSSSEGLSEPGSE